RLVVAVDGETQDASFATRRAERRKPPVENPDRSIGFSPGGLRRSARHHALADTVDGKVQICIDPRAGSRATKSRPSAFRNAIPSVAMATKSSVPATTSGLNPKRSFTYARHSPDAAK